MAKETSNNSGSIYNALTYGSVITGNIMSDNDFRIDGEVQGDMQCKGKVIIGQTGRINGNIICANAEIIGTVIGDIHANDTIILRATANLIGNIKAKTLAVEPNSIFQGSCSMKSIDATK